jgi:hypothetical protein
MFFAYFKQKRGLQMGKRSIAILIVILFLGIGIGYVISRLIELSLKPQLPEEVAEIVKDIRVILRESDVKNRTLYLDASQWYCKINILHGGDNPFPWDLAEANAPIVFFFLEDIEEPEKADNYSDLIIRMNPIIGKENGKRKMVVVFFAEGGYEKFVYYKTELLHHYDDEDPTSNYGIKLLPL